MIVVALFRNLNQGQAGTPRAAELASLFRAMGAEDARSIRANGTVAIRAPDPVSVVECVREKIARSSSWTDLVAVRDADWMEQLRTRLPDFAPTAEVAFFDSPAPFPRSLPWRPAQGRITVEYADSQHAICTNDAPRTSHATPAIEQLLGLPVTSRGADTVIRAAHAAQNLR